MSTETKSVKHKKEKPTPCPSTICPVSVTLEIISGKWKGIILYHLFSGNKRFSELKALIEGVTHRSLTLQLRELEEDGIITRTVFPVIPPHVEYALSPLGRTMEPIINAMYDWGVAYSKLDIKETQNSVSN
ncbi:winged helix-turn-helix transcriptional regulator [Veillonella seminalis]|uniref:HTH hxlR-type domain-containing protein n=1 Tax=Veillonella seminalis ACS-216-V-Col6b TaxID=883156 RepID=K9D1D8_9FIRM|nr:helix-turn-helix domain-containing protein [Veillonella seminalis]EKU78148.1 hypothetical protein HMPREF9282_01429 [Veillonella seminalis ACS-216-V-Col6b]